MRGSREKEKDTLFVELRECLLLSNHGTVGRRMPVQCSPPMVCRRRERGRLSACRGRSAVQDRVIGPYIRQGWRRVGR